MVGYFVAWLALVAASMPVSFSLILFGMAWLLIEGGTMITAPERLTGGIDSFPLLAVACFILAGVAMNSGRVTDRIYGFAKALVGHFTGGLAHVNVLGNLIFSGMSGSAVADAGGLGVLGILTPPFGIAPFVVAKVGNILFHVLARSILPFFGPLLMVQVIVTYRPRLVLFLPRPFFD